MNGTTFAAILTGITAFAASAGAAGASDKPRIALEVVGDGSRTLRDDVAAALGDFNATDAGELRAVTGPAGTTDRMAKLIDAPDAKLKDDARRAGAELDSKAIVVVRVRVRGQRGQRKLHAVVIDVERGTTNTVDVTLGARRANTDAKVIGDAFEPALKAWKVAPVAAASATGEPKIEPAPMGKTEPTPASKEAPRGAKEPAPPASEGPSMFSAKREDHAQSSQSLHRTGDPATALAFVTGEVGIASRSFDYHDRLSTALRSYDLGAAPFVKLGVEIYPLAERDYGALGNFAVTGGYGQAMLVSSRGESGGDGDTSFRAWNLGAKYRLRSGAGPMPVVGFGASYARTTFVVADAPLSGGAAAPSVDYGALRGGLDARSQLGHAAVFGGFGVGHVLSAGALTDRFQNATANSIDLQIGAAYRVLDGLEVRATLGYGRFFAKLNPEPGDRLVAGGTLDEYKSAMAGVAWAY